MKSLRRISKHLMNICFNWIPYLHLYFIFKRGQNYFNLS